jgi:hypothetical protein
MASIDRLGWAAGRAYLASGVRIGIRATSAAALARARALLPPGARPTDEPLVDRLYSLLLPTAASQPGLRHFSLLYADGARIARSLEAAPVLAALAHDLQLYVAEYAREHLFVHAGVVGWQGRALLLPGVSGAGKSTLTAALLRAGATYYADEYAVLDGRGWVHPYPQPLSLRGAAGTPPRRLPSTAFGAPVGRAPLPVGWVVLTRYQAGARWRPRRLLGARAVLALLEQTVAARRQPERALRTFQQVVTGAQVLHGVRGEADLLAARLLRELVEKYGED